MHITLEADYAVRIVDRLASQEGRLDAKSIAADTGVTPRFTLKILRKLAASGLEDFITTRHGVGYLVAQD